MVPLPLTQRGTGSNRHEEQVACLGSGPGWVTVHSWGCPHILAATGRLGDLYGKWPAICVSAEEDTFTKQLPYAITSPPPCVKSHTVMGKGRQ